MKKIIVVCLFLLFLLPLYAFSGEEKVHNEVLNLKETEIVSETIEQESIFEALYILHAGGVTPDGTTGSNSLEAIEHSYEKGYRVLEIDFCWTEDNQLVCVHDWDAYYAHRIGKDCVTFDEFEEARYSTYGFTSLTLDHLCEWLKEHKDVVIVTDIKENCVKGAKLISEEYPELKDNFCIQIYDKLEYEELIDLGFTKIIWTLYQLSWQDKMDTVTIVNFALTHNLVGITFSADLVDMIPNYVEKLKLSKTPLYIHTVNDYNSQCNYFNMGIRGIYTDYGRAKEMLE